MITSSDVGSEAARGSRTPAPSVHVSSQTLRRVLVRVALALAAASFVAQVLRFPLDSPRALGFVPLFDSDAEANIPTVFSSLLLLACATSLYLMAAAARRAGDRYARRWMVLALLFALATLDEAVQLHELANEHIASLTGVSDQALPWVVPAAALWLGLLIAYRDLARALPGPVRRRALLGGALLVAGALGLETLEAGVFTAFDGETADFADGLVSTVQELFEMLGVVLILEALVILLSLRVQSIRIRFR